MSTIPLAHARRIALRAQGLDGGWSLSPGLLGAEEAISRLGYVQIDTISVIERAHHHVLWTRHPDYVPAVLDDLMGGERRVFEYWTHAASYVPLLDYRFYVPMMRDFAKRPKVREWLRANRNVVRHVLERIRAEGPLRSADFATPREKRGPWWDWTPAKRALEILFRSGDLMIAGRWNFQRVYDLTERVLPPEVDVTPPRPPELASHIVRRALAAQGIVSAAEAGWWLKDAKRVAAAVQRMVQAGEAVEVQIAGEEGTPHYVSTEALSTELDRVPVPSRVHLLSPFDNLVIDRKRTERFFGFEYRIECYTPEPKRKYGYFTLPILWGDRLVGRLDPKADRSQGKFIVRSVVLEPDVEEVDELAPALAQALRDFANFNLCPEIAVEDPDRIDRRLLSAIREYGSE